MICDLPKTVDIDGIEYKIRNDCDYRVVLDVIEALGDDELDERSKVQCALFIFYDDLSGCRNIQLAIDKMMEIVNCGEDDVQSEDKPKIMDWNHDFRNIAPPISRVLGYSVRDSKNYTHWYDFIGAYMEIGDCYFAKIISYRNKRQRGAKLDKSDREFYRDHRNDIELPKKTSREERRWLDEE